MLAAEEDTLVPASPMFTTLQTQLPHDSQGRLLTGSFLKPNDYI